MTNILIKEDIIVLDELMYNTVKFKLGLDDNADYFYSFLISGEFNNNQEFFYRNINDLVFDLSEIMIKIENSDLGINAKDHLIYNISIVIKILNLLYK